jgi:large subunit ribosomal protein L9
MKQQLLLLEDVDNLGKSGDLVTVKAGYSRNFLIPQKRAILADKNTVKKQEKLKAEREKRALIDLKESEEIAEKLKNITLTTTAKIDPDGKMYGSVTANDISILLSEEGHEVDKKAIKLAKPLKDTGMHSITIQLKEGVEARIALNIKPEGVIDAVVDEVIIKPAETIVAPAEEDLENASEMLSHEEKKEVNDASKKI